MRLPLFQVDAFAARPFGGNPAAVVPLPAWLPDPVLQAIAEENNLAETAFLVQTPDSSQAHYHLRWFTPRAEVDLCGHATLAAAFVVFTELAFAAAEVRFATRSGVLTVARTGQGLRMLLPATVPQPCAEPPGLRQALGVAPREVLAGYDLIAVLSSQNEVRALQPDLAWVAGLPFRGLVVTAPGEPASGDQDEADFVSRFFAPQLGVPEDPVTGSAHAELVPLWAARLGRSTLRARQLSPRGGRLLCELLAGGDQADGQEVALTGPAVLFLRGELFLPPHP